MTLTNSVYHTDSSSTITGKSALRECRRRPGPKLVLALLITGIAMAPARAIVVFDPSNYAQNWISAINSVKQVQNQIRQLRNEAQMLQYEAKHLQRLDFNSLSRLARLLDATEHLISEANGVAFTVSGIERDFDSMYPAVYGKATSRKRLLTDSDRQWKNSYEALRTTLRLQALVHENFSEDQSVMEDLIARSQSAVGALQTAQTTNQLLALHTRQLLQAQQLEIVSGRAQALEAARSVSAEVRSRELRERFMTQRTSYSPARLSPLDR